MSQLLDLPAPTATAAGPHASAGRLVAAGAGSLATGAVAVASLLLHRHLFAAADSALARAVLSPPAVTGLLVAVALVGVQAAILGLVRPAADVTRTVMTAVAVTEVAVLGVALQNITTIALAGYLFAMALPFGVVWLAVQAIRRYPRLRPGVVAAVTVAVFWGVRTGPLQPAHLLGLAGDLGRGFASHPGELLLSVLFVAGTACWALLSIALLRDTPAAGRVSDRVLARRRGLTLLAAAGPLPYALIRATWLTPWPLLVPGEETLSPEIRLWGLLLGGGALAGSVLTVGLIRPWGVTFPRWMPWWAGRPVPVRAATVPGGLVAGIVSASALPMLRGILFPEHATVFGGLPLLERLSATLIFPFWCWGPALALAVWGYALARGEVRSTADGRRAADGR